MALAGSRFDPEVMRREAEAAREREKRKKIQSLVVNGCVLVALGIAALVGWRYWQNYSAEKERQAQAQQAREAQQRAEAARKEAERKEALRVKREQELARQKAEQQRREEERKRQAQEREEERIRKEQERIRQRQEQIEARQREEKAKVEFAQRKLFVDKAMNDLPMKPTDHIAVRQGLAGKLSFEVDGKRWEQLSEIVTQKSAMELFEFLRDASMTNEFSASCYPDRETFNRMLEKLNKEVFHLVIRPSASASDLVGLSLVTLDSTGLVTPKGARELSAGGRRGGWTVPFVFGGEPNLFLLESRSIAAFSRDWKKIRYRTKDADVPAELKSFARSLQMELTRPVPVEAPKPVVKQEAKPKATFKGGSDIRSFRGSKR